jgi:hypothetical protein
VHNGSKNSSRNVETATTNPDYGPVGGKRCASIKGRNFVIGGYTIGAKTFGHDTHSVEVILTLVGADDTPSRVVVPLDSDQSGDAIRAAVTASLLEHPSFHM